MPCSLSFVGPMALMGTAMAAQMLAPIQDINLPASDSASEPLKWLGGNGPYFAGTRRAI